MFKKIFFAVALAAAPLMFAGEAAAEYCPGDFGYRGYRPSYGYSYRPPIPRYPAHYYSRYRGVGPVSPFGYGVGFGSPYRYGVGYPFYGRSGTAIGINRGGFSLHIGR
ncbi:MAG: hypothetical protein AAGA03_10465 [Planctomycetota bacterium]